MDVTWRQFTGAIVTSCLTFTCHQTRLLIARRGAATAAATATPTPTPTTVAAAQANQWLELLPAYRALHSLAHTIIVGHCNL